MNGEKFKAVIPEVVTSTILSDFFIDSIDTRMKGRTILRSVGPITAEMIGNAATTLRIDGRPYSDKSRVHSFGFPATAIETHTPHDNVIIYRKRLFGWQARESMSLRGIRETQDEAVS